MSLKTGIKWLDDIFGEYIPKGSILILRNDPTVESDSVMYQTFFETVKNGDQAIFLTTTRSPSSVIYDFNSFGWDFSVIKSKVTFIDGYSAMIGAVSDAEYLVKKPNDLNEILNILEMAIENKKNKTVIVISSLSTIIDFCGEEKFIENFSRLKQILNKASLSIIQFTQWPYKQEVLDLVKTANAIVEIKGLEQRVVFGQYLSVSKVDWLNKKEIEEKNLLFKVIKPGGVRLFVPKIIVSGPYHAGKSSFIHTLSDKAVSVDRLGTTIALDHGQIDRHGLSADLFGTPGQERFNPIIKMISEGSIGVIVVVDSTDPASFQRAKEMIDVVWQKGLPIVLAANKQDVAGALQPEEIQDKLGLKQFQIVPCVARDKDRVLRVFDTLIDQIIAKGSN